MRAFFGGMLITSVALLSGQRVSGAEFDVIEEVRKAQKAWLHPVWRAVKLGDQWEQEILDAFLARSASSPSAGRLVFVCFESDDPDEQFAAEYPDCFLLVRARSRKDLQPKMLRKLTVVIRDVSKDDLGFASVAVQKGVPEDTTPLEGIGLLDDLRYGFICTPIGNPLTCFCPPRFETGCFEGLCIPTKAEVKFHCEMIAARRHHQLIENRAIVARQRGKKMPAWGGGFSSAFIVEPAIWYFDPDSRVQKMDCTDGEVVRDGGISAARTKENAPVRRTVADFVFQDYDDARIVNRPTNYMGPGLFR